MKTSRQDKVARLVQKEMGDILQKENHNILPKKMITVTVVRMTADLSIAKIFLSIFPSNEKEKDIKHINQLSKPLRHELGKRIKNQIRAIPEVHFLLDDSLDYIEKIDNLLKE